MPQTLVNIEKSLTDARKRRYNVRLVGDPDLEHSQVFVIFPGNKLGTTSYVDNLAKPIVLGPGRRSALIVPTPGIDGAPPLDFMDLGISPNTKLSPEQLADAVASAMVAHDAELLGLAGIKRDIILVCHSMGGGRAIRLAEQFPHLVRGVALLAPNGVPDGADRPELEKRLKRSMRHYNGQARNHGVVELARTYAAHWALMASGQHIDPDRITTYAINLDARKAAERLGLLQVPSIIIGAAGDGDVLITHEMRKELAKAMSAELHEVDGCHMAGVTHNAQLLAKLEDFFTNTLDGHWLDTEDGRDRLEAHCPDLHDSLFPSRASVTDPVATPPGIERSFSNLVA